ncbi:FAD/NAD(P)-binding domain-containing protein [Ophiobolus disseminans]|uniref:FAD/NAD(P)-binding domain-containing protein n=1 Tax=Ophiobolus disseminans TaxID=1469910 RepID=A0A6A7A3U3_9PLEO|nr:FAD/NAD(P)-binding domain-containing protein [Ophiobolus disseminans]
MAHSNTHVIIIGAGITGLVLAQALQKDGIPFTIVERDASLNVRSNEWTMAIHWALERLETLLPPHIYAKLEAASCNPAIPINAGGTYPIIHAESGSMLAGVPYARGMRVPRSKMRALVSEGIDVQFNKKLIEVDLLEPDLGVVAKFADGTSVKGSMIVGAEGARSKVREIAMGSVEEAATTSFPIWHMNLTVCYGDAEKAQFVRRDFPTSFLALSQRSFHAFQSISSMPSSDPASWIFHLAMAWNGSSNHDLSHAEKLALIKEKAKDLAEPARSSFMWIPEGTQVHRADISYWITRQWENRSGRLTLVGDAAHPMPPCEYLAQFLHSIPQYLDRESLLKYSTDRGQGLNHCIADLHSLAAQIKLAHSGIATWAEAIGGYEAELVPRGAEEVKCSIENGIMLHDWEKVKQSPVFTKGFRPMKGHDGYETNSNPEENLRKADLARGGKGVEAAT